MLFTVTNNFSLISINIGPTSLVAIATILAGYGAFLYSTAPKNHGDNGGTRRRLLRPSLFKRLTRRLRKERAQPKPSLWSTISQSAFGIQIGERGRIDRDGFGRRV